MNSCNYICQLYYSFIRGTLEDSKIKSLKNQHLSQSHISSSGSSITFYIIQRTTNNL